MNHFLELIQIAIGTRPAPLSSSPTDKEWEELFDMSKKQAIVGVLFSGIEKLPEEQCPCKRILLEWYLLTTKIEDRNRQLNSTAVKVAQRFLKDGMRSCVLKGQGIATLYPQPLRRQSGDIDLWVEGDRNTIIQYLRRHNRSTQIVYHHADFNVLKDIELEVHFTPTWMYAFPKDKILQKWFAGEADAQFSNIIPLPSEAEDSKANICAPTTEFNIVFLLVHIFRHLLDEGIGLRQLMDYYFLLTATPIDNQTKANALTTLQKLGLKNFTAAVMYAMQQIFGMQEQYMLIEPNKDEGTFLIEEIMLAGNFGKYDLRSQSNPNESSIQKLIRKQTRRKRFLRYYTEETLYAPLFILWQRCWRKYKGYL